MPYYVVIQFHYICMLKLVIIYIPIVIFICTCTQYPVLLLSINNTGHNLHQCGPSLIIKSSCTVWCAIGTYQKLCLSGIVPSDTDEICTFKVNALIESLTVILESINLIVQGICLPHPQNYFPPTVHYIKWYSQIPIPSYSCINART